MFRIFPISKSGPWRNNNLTIGKDARLRGRVLLQYDKGCHGNRVVLGDECELNNVKIHFTGNNSTLILGDKAQWRGRIRIEGDNRTVSIGSGTACVDADIFCSDADVYIGRGCLISRKVEIRTSDQHELIDMATDTQLNNPGGVSLGEHVWLCAHVIIGKGAHISRGSVVGTMSFVNQKFKEPNVVVAGVPARIVRHGIRWNR